MPRHRVQPILPMTEAEYKAHIESIVPEKTKSYLVIVSYPDDDHQFGYSPGGKKVEKMGRKRLVRDAVAYYLANGFTYMTEAPIITEGEKKGQKDYSAQVPRAPKNLGEVYRDVSEHNGGDSEWGATYVITAKQHLEAQEKELREKGESIAALICSIYGVKPGTLKFVNACYKHYKKIVEGERHYRDDPERRAERWAEYQFAGAARETFFEDNDFASSQIADAQDRLNDVISYLEKFSPLLMTRYRETVARLTTKKKTDS